MKYIFIIHIPLNLSGDSTMVFPVTRLIEELMQLMTSQCAALSCLLSLSGLSAVQLPTHSIDPTLQKEPTIQLSDPNGDVYLPCDIYRHLYWVVKLWEIVSMWLLWACSSFINPMTLFKRVHWASTGERHCDGAFKPLDMSFKHTSLLFAFLHHGHFAFKM